MGTSTATRYEGRHRDDSINGMDKSVRRDGMVRMFGQWYKARHATDGTR